MTEIVTFAVVQLLVSGFACWRGGAPERVVGLLLAAAFAASMLTPLMPAYTYRGLNWAVLRIDLVLLVGLVAVALFADRYWPLWLAALQLVAVAAHGVRLYNSQILPVAYWSLTSRVAYPMVAMLIVAVVRHQRRLSIGLPEYAWTWQRLRQFDRSTSSDDGGRSD